MQRCMLSADERFDSAQITRSSLKVLPSTARVHQLQNRAAAKAPGTATDARASLCDIFSTHRRGQITVDCKGVNFT
jgi:hypothetical protein